MSDSTIIQLELAIIGIAIIAILIGIMTLTARMSHLRREAADLWDLALERQDQSEFRDTWEGP